RMNSRAAHTFTETFEQERTCRVASPFPKERGRVKIDSNRNCANPSPSSSPLSERERREKQRIFRGARASRVLVSASRRNSLFLRFFRTAKGVLVKVRDREDALASTRDARAPRN